VNAREWLATGSSGGADAVVVGAPISRASISASRAHTTPAALRRTLERFSTWDGDHGVSLEELRVRDLGDVEGDAADSDASASHRRIEQAVAEAHRNSAPVVVVIGGDNSLTAPAMRGLSGGMLAEGWGLLTFDTHHDVRPLDDGPRNGTPVRELIEGGLPGSRVAQIGVHGFANAREHAAWVGERGVHVVHAGQVRARGMAAVIGDTLDALGASGMTRLYVDVDLDVLERACAPGCPASMPGGLLPAQLQEAAYQLGGDRRVQGLDLCEVDAEADVNGITLRAMASVLLAFCAGLVRRKHSQSGSEE
jgi:formiminoglutamase